jgi:hypothetical protein
VQEIKEFQDDASSMEKMSVLHETVLEWQTASSNIRNNVKQQTQARVEVISSLKREKVCSYAQSLRGLELTSADKGRGAQIEKERS